MKDTILKSLFYQTLFLNEKDRNEKIMRNLHNPNDVIIFIDAILYTLQNTNFFQINNSRMESLIEILKKIQSHPMWPISRFQQLDNKAIENIINLCKEQIAQNKENSYKNVLAGINKDICYSMQEMQKRTLLYSSFTCTSPEKVAQYILTDYPIINSLVTRLELPKEKNRVKDILSALSLLITTYKELLLEDKPLYHFILDYLNSLASSLKSLRHRYRIQIIREQYLALQFPDKEAKITFTY